MSSGNYWNQSQEDAVIRYQTYGAGSPEANRVFDEQLYIPLRIMVSSIIQRLHLHSYEELVFDTVVHLMLKLERYDPARGSKAYSYFSSIAKNYLINNLNKMTRDNNKLMNIDDVKGL